MKTWKLALIVLFTGRLANAVSIQQQIFATVRVPVLVGLACPGSSALQLRQLMEWRAAGDRIGDYATSAAMGPQISSLVSFFMFAEGESVSLKNTEFSNEGSIDADSLDLPAKSGSCDVVPLAFDASQLRDGPAYLADAAAFDRLAPMDRFVARLLLKGFRENTVRAMLDGRQLVGTQKARYDLAQSRGLPTLLLGSAEVIVGDDAVRFNGENIARAHVLSDYSAAIVTFYENGRLHDVADLSQWKSFRTSIADGKAAITTEKAGALNCWGVTYRRDGSIARCGIEYIDVNGTHTHLDGERGRPEGQNTYYGQDREDLADLREIFVLARGSEPEVVNFGPSEGQLVSAMVAPGELACASITVANTALSDGRFEPKLTIPGDCLGIAHLTWRINPPPAPAPKPKPQPAPHPKPKPKPRPKPRR